MCWSEYLSAFTQADHVIMTEVYAASEEPIVGVSGEALLAELHHSSKEFCADIERVVDVLPKELQSNDLVLCLGAGSVGALPEKLLSALSGANSVATSSRNDDVTVLRVVGGK
jgi:UDP-N-acetylmuramate--alanine ligase